MNTSSITKTIALVVTTLICMLFLGASAEADVLMPNTHILNRCVSIVNTNQYPEYVLVAYITGPMASASGEGNAWIVDSSACLSKGYKFNRLHLVAFKKDYFESVGISKLTFTKTIAADGTREGAIIDANAIPSSIEIEPYGGSIDDADHRVNETVEYRIVAISDELQLQEMRVITDYNDGKPQIVKTNEYHPVDPASKNNTDILLPPRLIPDALPHPRGFWGSIGCFLKGIFGAACQ